MKVDLHIHTSYSDGAFSPEKIVDTAIDVGLDAIAITDHDNVLSHKIALDYAKDKSLKILPGVEINTIYKGYEVHILGYFMDLEDSDFQKLIKTQQQARVKQTKEIITLLAKRAGIKITLDSIVSQVAPGGSIGRPHIAKAITNAGGTSSSIEAYNKYINDNSNVYVQRKTVTPFEAVAKATRARYRSRRMHLQRRKTPIPPRNIPPRSPAHAVGRKAPATEAVMKRAHQRKRGRWRRISIDGSFLSQGKLESPEKRNRPPSFCDNGRFLSVKGKDVRAEPSAVHSLSGAGDLTGTQATGANSDGLVSTVHNCLYLANVGLPGAIGLTVGVRHILTVNNTLSADTAFCHYLTPPYCGFGPARL